MTLFADVGMGRNLAFTFVYFLVVSYCLAYLATLTFYPGAEFMPVFRFMTTAALLVFLSAIVAHSIWFRCRIVGHIVESILYALIVGVIFAAMWPGAFILKRAAVSNSVNWTGLPKPGSVFGDASLHSNFGGTLSIVDVPCFTSGTIFRGPNPTEPVPWFPLKAEWHVAAVGTLALVSRPQPLSLVRAGCGGPRLAVRHHGPATVHTRARAGDASDRPPPAPWRMLPP